MDSNEVRGSARRARHFVVLAFVALLSALGAEVMRWAADAPPAVVGDAGPPPASAATPFETRSTARDVTLTRVSSATVPSPDDAPRVHASTLAVLPGNEVLAFWWAGSRESGPDVQVYSAIWRDGAWGPSTALFGREKLSEWLGFGVRRIGNPSAWVAQDGTVHLYVVATGLGGWAAGRIAHLTSTDRGQRFEVKRMLPMSPLWNTSVLVRTAPVSLADGGWWLPAYFELGNKYSLLMAFDRDGEPRALSRIGSSHSAFQPAVVATAPNTLRAWMRVDRAVDNAIHQAISTDGGHRWDDLPTMPMASQYSSVAALRLRDGGYVLLHNDEVAGSDTSRGRLRLMVSKDADTWQDGLMIEASDDVEAEFSYPSVQQIGDELHVSYTDRRSRITHHVYRIRYGASG